MPRQDVNDNRGMHNLQGIDLRKNADSNSAEDMVNVWINSQHYFTNRPMPDVYTVGQTTFGGSYRFACECKNLAGSEVEIDISSAEGVPTVSEVKEATDESGDIWILGSNLETVREILWCSPEGGVLISGTDFSFYYDRENNRLAVCYKEGKEDLDTSAYTYFVLISPYGQVSTQYAGQIADYCFGSKNEYRLRTFVKGGLSFLTIEAKADNGSYVMIERWVDASAKVDPDAKHYTISIGSGSLTFNAAMSNTRAVFATETVDDALVLKLTYSGGTAQTWSGAASRDESVPQNSIEIPGDFMLGDGSPTPKRFKFHSSGSGITLSELNDDTYNPIAEFSTV